MPLTTTTSLDDAIPVFKAAARTRLRRTGTTRKLVDNITLGKGQGLTYREPHFSEFSVIALSQGVDLSQAQELTDTLVSIAVSPAGGQVVVHDMAVDAMKDPIVRRIGEQLANAYAYYVDNDLTSLFSGLDVGFGSAGSSFSSGWLFAGSTRLAASRRPTQGPISIILHPYHARDVLSDIQSLRSGGWVYTVGTPSVAVTTGASISGLTQEAWEQNAVATLAGHPVYLDPTITVDSSDDSYSAILARDSLIFVAYAEPDMETDRDASALTTELNYTGIQGRGERDGTWGFYFLADATAPTS